MRRLLLLALIVAAMFYCGWLAFQNDDAHSTIIIDKKEIKADAEQATETVKQKLGDAVDSVSDESDGR